MAQPDQRCEDCNWWKWAELRIREEDHAIGFCMFPNERLPESANLEQMYCDEGTMCPCWEAKE